MGLWEAQTSLGWAMWTPEPLDPCAASVPGSVLRGHGARVRPLIAELRRVDPNWINPVESNSIEVVGIKYKSALSPVSGRLLLHSKLQSWAVYGSMWRKVNVWTILDQPGDVPYLIPRPSGLSWNWKK